MLGTVKYHSPRTTPSYCPTVKSIRFSTVPAGSRTSTCQAPVQSAGTVFLLQVRQGEPPTASSTSPTWVSPWNQTWWIAVAAVAPPPLVHSTPPPPAARNPGPPAFRPPAATGPEGWEKHQLKLH